MLDKLLIIAGFALCASFLWRKAMIVVPLGSVFLVERWGLYKRTLKPGPRFIVPFVDVIRYKQSVKETLIDIPEQLCITHDNVQLRLDAVLYLKVIEPQLASYAVANFAQAITTLAQTSLRNEVGKVELDDIFERRSWVKLEVFKELTAAAGPWGLQILRYEIKNIVPPPDLIAVVNAAEGAKQQMIKESEATRQQQINNAQGAAAAIMEIANATAEGIRTIGGALREPGGMEAMQLRVAEQYVNRVGELAKSGTTVVLPSNLTDIGSLMTSALGLRSEPAPAPVPPPRPREDAPRSS